MELKTSAAADGSESRLAASARRITLPAGLFVVSVTKGEPAIVAEAGHLQLPALHVAAAPGVSEADVQFVAGTDTHGNWLMRPGQMLVVKVSAKSVPLLLTSIRAPSGRGLDVAVRRLDGTVGAPVAQGAEAQAQSNESPSLEAGPRVQIGCHIRGRGDMNFPASDWAGRVATGAWIEAFSITALEAVSPDDIEYKGLTSSGFETPWLSAGAACGTRGMAVPLVGFAVRPSEKMAQSFDCEYSGYFRSGATVGPLRNGTPCRSTTAGDPLEGIRFRLVARASTTSTVPARSAPSVKVSSRKPPRFSRFREDDEPSAVVAKPVPKGRIAAARQPSSATIRKKTKGARAKTPRKP